jgi:6-phosphogluconolactonase
VPGVKIEIVDDPARVCADRLLDVARAGGQIVASGGSTPRAAYQLAAAEPGAWPSATLWFGDERCVPPDDERSNFRMVREALLDPLGPEAAPTVHRIQGELGPFAAADEYEDELHDAFGAEPRFDLLLLGIGPDGHTASLFPDQAAVSEHTRLVAGVEQAGLEPFVPRVTMTMPALAAARVVLFLAVGESKADALAAAFGPDAVPTAHLPSSLLPTLTDDLFLLVDAAAAAKL